MSDPRTASPREEPTVRLAWHNSAWARYASAIAAVVASAGLTFALVGLIGAREVRAGFVFFYLAVFLSARYGGRGPGLLSVVLSALAADYFLVAPDDLLSPDFPGLLQLTVFVLVALLVVYLTERSRRAEAEADVSRESMETTLKSIGDAVIATDTRGRVTFMNGVAQRLTGWPLAEAAGRPLAEVFRILNEETRAEVESPVAKVLRAGEVVGLANHTALIARDGSEVPVEDSAAPIKDRSGNVTGVVLVFHDIAERRKTEASLQRRERELTDFIENASVGLHWVGADGTILWANRAELEMLGYDAEEYIGRNIAEFHADREVIEDILTRLSGRQEIHGYEARLRHKDGSVREASINSNVLWDDEGRFVHTRCFTRDITQEKRAGQERAHFTQLVERERVRLKNLVANVPGVVWEAWGAPDEASQHIDFVSDHVEQMLGYTVEEWLSTPNFWLSIVHPDDRERAAVEAHAIFESRTGGTSEFRWLGKDGRVVEVSAQSVVIRDERGEPVGMRGVTLDITERKRAEGRLGFLAEAGEMLASSLDFETTLERLARLAVSALADYCLIDMVGDDGEVRRVATAHADPAHEAAVSGLRRFPPDMSKHEGVSKVLRTGQTEFVPLVTQERLRSITRNVEHRELLERLGLKSFMTVPLVTRERVTGALTLALTGAGRAYTPADVSFAEELARRAALAIENARLYGRAQEVNRAKDEFLATLSHELRTPLTPVIGWTHMILSGRLGPSDVVQGMHVIDRNSQALSRLINDLLDMSSILSGKMKIERAPVEIDAVVREAFETVRPHAESRGVALELFADERPVPAAVVNGDRTRLVQVFWNLLHNAVKFSARGGRVRVRVEGTGGAARVHIEDNGQGITPEFLPHVFERFRQADMGTTRAHGGLGIGLALVKSFVEAHGGRVEAASPGAGRGSSFVVSLPALRATNGDDTGVEQSDAQQPEPCLAEPCDVLIIEDAPDTLEMLRVVFEARGYGVSACGSAEEALRVAEAGRFDIIICDIGLPRIDGYELIGRLRSLPHLHGVPAVALTGYAAPKDSEAALAAGFDAHLAKPVEPSALVAEVEQLLKLKVSDEP
jgi:PAS domain S-box-containing protein